jgi:GDPmannose 4,6-dehydratase
MMLQRDTPDDYVLGTGQSHSVRDFVNAAFDAAGFTLTWTGIGVGETARCARTGRLLVSIDPSLFRPTEVNNLIADPAKARTILGWTPETDFLTLVRDMVAAAMDSAQTSHRDDNWANDNDARIA